MKKYNNLGLLIKMVTIQKQLKKDISKISVAKFSKDSSIVLYQVPPRNIICYREKKL